ncbi:DUF3892 domain-containing protein [Sinomonas albida]|uniref:DUF3892 domain-containing protein n=1 Tax=Sinomonas albida TaxID=369942 RepID=UPI00301AC1D1
MAIQITHIRLSGGAGHEHITRLWWRNANGSGDNSRAEIVAWIEDKNGEAFVADSYGHHVEVRVVKPAAGAKYLRTYADGVWTDNLLALPRR